MRFFRKWAPPLLPVLLLGGIVALFVAQLTALARYRVDYPIQDDWRYYFQGFGMPDELSLQWLMKPAQDTVHVSGKLIDWLYFHFVAHDYSSLAVFSFALCIGGWLVCAVALCWLAGRGRPLIFSASLLAFALPLAAVPYWVAASPNQWLEPLVAYHQVFPIVGLFALGLLAASGPSRFPASVRLTGAYAVTIFFALAYSSGAVALVILGGTLAGTAWLAGGRGQGHDPLRALGGVILAGALLSLAAHVLIPWQAHGANPVIATRTHSITLPWDGHYWHFFFGLFDRAVLSTSVNGRTFLRGAAVSLAVIAPLVPLSALLLGGSFQGRERSVAIAILAIILSVLVYAALVAYGRGSFGTLYFPREHPLRHRAGLYAHTRFFYWWIAAILPLAVVAWGLAWERLHSRKAAGLVAAALVVLALWPKSQHPDYPASYFGHWDFAARYARDETEVRDLIEVDLARARGEWRFASRRLAWARLPREFRNVDYRPAFPSGKPYYARAEAAGASFIRRWVVPSGHPPTKRRGRSATAEPAGR